MEGQGEDDHSNQEGSIDQQNSSYQKHKKKKKNYNNYYYGNNGYNNYYNYNSKSYGNYYNYNYGYSNNKYDKYDNYYKGNYGFDYDYKSKQKKNIDYFLNKIDNTKIIIPELTQNLINDLQKNKLSCLICELVIKKDQSTWSCNKCYSIIHLNCVTEWIKKNNPNFNINSKDENSILSWTCPHCKYLYDSDNYPIYNCYCGKYYNAVKEKNKYLDTIVVNIIMQLKKKINI